MADKNPSDNNGVTALHNAAENGHLEVCKTILVNTGFKIPAAQDGYTPLHLAAQEGHVSLCRLILKFAIEKNPRKEDSITPLHTAAYCGHLEVCKILIEEAPDKEPVIMGDGKTPALLAKENNHDKVFIYLTEYVVAEWLRQWSYDLKSHGIDVPFH